MQLTVLAVPGCPNARVLEQRLASLLVDGRDPFAGSGSGSVVACRLYRDEQGRLDGAPTVSALRGVLERAGARD